jgi:copper(I)-binding protein
MRSLRLPRPTLVAGVLAAALLVAPVLSGCGEDTPQTGEDTPETTAAQADTVSASDTWVKAVDEGMTGVFGVLSNSGTESATLVTASSDASDRVEIHETVMADGGMVMQPKEGGLVIAAGGEAVLEPGGDHIMLMEVVDPIRPGDEVVVTLEFSDGSTLDLTATAKTFTGGGEEYQSGQS